MKKIISYGIAGFMILALPVWSNEVAERTSGDTAAPDWENLRAEALNRPRRVIYNNDADDGTWWPRNLAMTRENFLARRLKTMEGSQVDTMFYVVQISFGHTVYDSNVGKMLEHNTQREDVTVIGPEFRKQGTDSFQVAIEEAHRQNREIFGSFRMNDIHDSWWAPDEKKKWVWLFSDFKRQHPDLLFGSHGEVPPYGQWSAVDYDSELVRETFLKMFREVCEKYDMDGLELDFFRWPYLFRTVGWGTPATEAQREKFSALMKEARAIAETCGKKRGRPILLAVRVPDSPEYAAALGMDFKRWMEEKWIDLVIGGGNLNLSSYEALAELAKRCQVRYYPSLDMPQFDEPKSSLRRDVPENYYARALSALIAGADGTYYFNVFSPERVKQLMLGDLATLSRKDKRYFVTDVLIDRPEKYLRDGAKYVQVRRLSPLDVCVISPRAPEKFRIYVGDDFSGKNPPRATVFVKGSIPTASQLNLAVNGQPAKQLGHGETLTEFAVPEGALQQKWNEFTLSLKSAFVADTEKFRTIMSGKQLLKGQNQAPWRRLYSAHDFANSEAIENDAYRLTDSGDGANEIANLTYPIFNAPDDFVVRWECRVASSDSPRSVVVRLADRRHVEIVSLQTNQVALLNAKVSKALDTTDTFHRYELRMLPERVELWVDGAMFLSGETPVTVHSEVGNLQNYTYDLPRMHDSSLLLGSLSGPGRGSAWFRNVELLEDAEAGALRDLILELDYPENNLPKNVAEFPVAEILKAAETHSDGLGAFPLTMAPGSAPAIALSAEVKRSEGALYWMVSNGRQVSSLLLESDGALSLARDVFGAAAPAPGKIEQAVLTLNAAEIVLTLDGREIFRRDRTFGVADFLNDYGDLLNAEERKVVQQGGVVCKLARPGATVCNLKMACVDLAAEEIAALEAADAAIATEVSPEKIAELVPGKNKLTEDFSSTYQQGNFAELPQAWRLNQSDGKAPFQLLRLRAPETKLILPAQSVLLLEWKLTPQLFEKNQGVFNFSCSAGTDFQSIRTLDCKLYADRFFCAGVGEAAWSWEANEEKTLQILFSPETGGVIVDADGTRLLSGKILALRTDGKPDFWCGDGSGATGGIVKLQHLKLSRIPAVQAVDQQK